VRVQLGHDPAGGWTARPCPGQGSHQIRSMALADGLALLPDGDGGVAAGELVEVLVTDPAFAGSVLPG
jgi:molybdopterin molybdotransferase